MFVGGYPSRRALVSRLDGHSISVVFGWWRTVVTAAGTMAVIAGLCGCVASARSAGTAQYRPPLVSVSRVSASTSAHRQAAIRDAKQLLAGVVVPSGSVVGSSSSGVGPHTLLLTSVLNSAVQRRSWTIPEDSSAVLSFVTAHLPSGSKVESTGSGGPQPMQSVIRAWPPVRDVLGLRWVQIQVTATGSEQTLLSAVAQSQWIVDRSASQRVPTSVREITVTSRVPRQQPFLSRTVSNQKQIRALVKLFNSLPLVQPAVTSCPEELSDQPVVTITFRDRTTGQPAARAHVSSAANIHWPANAGAWGCFATQLSLRGHQAALSGNVIGPLQRLLGVNLAKPPEK